MHACSRLKFNWRLKIQLKALEIFLHIPNLNSCLIDHMIKFSILEGKISRKMDATSISITGHVIYKIHHNSKNDQN